MVERRSKRTLIAAIWLLSATLLTALPHIPDTSFARRVKIEDVFAPIEPMATLEREFVNGATPVVYRTYEQNDRRYYLFIPADREDMDLVSPGTYIVRRRIQDGATDQVKIFLGWDEGTFVRVRPRGRGSELDLSVSGYELYRSVPIGVSMETILRSPFDVVYESSAQLINWSLFDVATSHPGYARIEHVVDLIRGALPTLPDAEDGAMDEHGNLVYIEGLENQEKLPGFNCSGFAKWVVDGFYGPLTGGYLPIEPLKEKHLDYRGNPWTNAFEETRDPFFGLDWTRNLAREYWTARSSERANDPESFDVRSVGATHAVEDMGFDVPDLPLVLYRLAQSQPGTFYLGSVAQEFGSDPVLRQHSHVVVFFPWFDDNGVFHVAVMERNVETSLESILSRYPSDLVHLVSLEATDEFAPPIVESASVAR